MKWPWEIAQDAAGAVVNAGEAVVNAGYDAGNYAINAAGNAIDGAQDFIGGVLPYIPEYQVGNYVYNQVSPYIAGFMNGGGGGGDRGFGGGPLGPPTSIYANHQMNMAYPTIYDRFPWTPQPAYQPPTAYANHQMNMADQAYYDQAANFLFPRHLINTGRGTEVAMGRSFIDYANRGPQTPQGAPLKNYPAAPAQQNNPTRSFLEGVAAGGAAANRR